MLWLAGSAAFSFYVSHFARYNKTYGSPGVVVILMTWFLLSVYCVLLGAEINAEMEHQTVKDTTVGGEKPMGRRQAYVATPSAARRKKRGRTRSIDARANAIRIYFTGIGGDSTVQ